MLVLMLWSIRVWYKLYLYILGDKNLCVIRKGLFLLQLFVCTIIEE